MRRDSTQTHDPPVATGRPGQVPAERTAPAAPRPRGYAFEILLVSFSGLLLEISYTRVISFKLFYYYTYLVIGLALLGIGSGAVVVAISGRLRRASTDAILMWGLLLGGASVGVGYLVVARTSVATLEIWDYGTLSSVTGMASLLLICLAMFASFIAIGVMIATLFGRRSEEIGRLYFADLVGAGLACAVVVTLLGAIGPPATIFLAGLLLALAGIRIAQRRRSRALPAGVVAAAVLAVGVVAPGVLPRQREDPVKETLTDGNTMFSSWSPLFRVDVADFGDLRLLYHDGLLGSVIFRYDGDVSSLTRFDGDPRSFPFAVLGRDPDDVMIIGAAGGHEILASLYFEAGRIDAVELNPVTHSLVTDKYAEYAGRLDEIPGVNYVKDDGRSFLARSDDAYDLIWYPAPDSYSAANAATAGAFVLSESYLYTSDTIVESLDHLSADGIVATQYAEYDYDDKPNRTTRYVSTARHALAEQGVDDPGDHILVATSQAGSGATNTGASLSTILVKKSPFTAEEVDRFTGQLGEVEGSALQYAPGRPAPGGAVDRVVSLPDGELERFYESYPYDVGPITDDGPFFWHFTPFGDVLREIGEPVDRTDLEDTIGERVLLLLLVVATAFATVFLLLPFLAIRQTWRALPRKGTSALYFAALGLGFMFFEITLIQRLTLFLGYPTYSLTVTLASILVFTGVGALVSERFRQTARVVPVLIGTLALLTVFYLVGLPPLTDAALGWPLAPRVLLAFVVLAPLGLCLGMFMPLGLGAVARLTEFPREYVAWGWAINGFASVIGAVLTTILAMTFGFRAVLLLALVVYLVAVAVLRVLLRAAPAAA